MSRKIEVRENDEFFLGLFLWQHRANQCRKITREEVGAWDTEYNTKIDGEANLSGVQAMTVLVGFGYTPEHRPAVTPAPVVQPLRITHGIMDGSGLIDMFGSKADCEAFATRTNRDPSRVVPLSFSDAGEACP